MSDSDDRLAALDPAANETYRRRDLDAMIARIVAAPSPAGTRWRGPRVRLAGGLALASLVTAVSLALVQGAPSLPALAIQRALITPTEDFATLAPLATNQDVRFLAGSGLAASAPSTASVELTVPSDPKAETAALAAVFGLVGAPASRGDGNWSVTSASGPALTYESTGIPQWYYSSTSSNIAPATESGRADVSMPSHATVKRDAEHYVGEFGFGYTLRSPSFSTATRSATTASGAPLSVRSETVSYTVAVHGTTTDQSVSFTVDPSNALLYAQGPAFSVSRSLNYPLQSPLAGVATLNAAERRAGAAAPSTTPAAKVALTRATLSLAGYELENRTLWLLPVYTYSGSVHPENGSAAASAWSELAIKPSYLDGSASVTRTVSY